MAAAICRYAGARHVVVTDVNPWRLDLAKKLGATRTIDVRHERIAEVQKELGMSEGFDVGLEMSGNASAFREMLANLCHGGKVAMLGTLIKLVMLVSWVVEAFWTTFPGSSPFHVTGNGYFGSWLAVAFAAQMFYAVAPAMPEGRTSEVLSSKSVDAEVSKAAVEEDAMAL
jgi:NADPH:quinone reductase-like Zn-dependent oxidoreductase